jgi:hypothetical protein
MRRRGGGAIVSVGSMWAVLQPLEWLWLLVLGVVLWRESNTAREAAIG